MAASRGVPSQEAGRPVRHSSVWTTALFIVVVGICVLAGCRRGSDSAAESGSAFVCTHGIAASGNSETAAIEKCISCAVGYAVDSNERCVAIEAGTAAAAYTAGYREFTVGDTMAGVWYPSTAEPVPHRIGPFAVAVAYMAPPAEGRHHIVLLSHGLSGRFRNHHITAQVLAEAGYVVAAPTHLADSFVGGQKTAAALEHRIQDLTQVLAALRSDNELSAHLADTPIHGVGYSLGGMTMLLAAGARFDHDLVKQHCAQYGWQDWGFCQYSKGFSRGVVRVFQRIWQARFTPSTTTSLQRIAGQFQPDEIIVDGKLVLIAPTGQGADLVDSISGRDIAILAIAGDGIVPPSFHAAVLAAGLAPKNAVSAGYLPGHHYAFIAPIPKWLTDREDIPVAQDSPSFNRRHFIETANVFILDFLQR